MRLASTFPRKTPAYGGTDAPPSPASPLPPAAAAAAASPPSAGKLRHRRMFTARSLSGLPVVSLSFLLSPFSGRGTRDRKKPRKVWT